MEIWGKRFASKLAASSVPPEVSAAHQDQPQPEARKHAAERHGNQRLPRILRHDARRRIDYHGGKRRCDHGLDNKLETEYKKTEDKKGNVHHQDHRTDGQAEYVIEHRRHACQPAGRNVVRRGENVDGSGIQQASNQKQHGVGHITFYFTGTQFHLPHLHFKAKSALIILLYYKQEKGLRIKFVQRFFTVRERLT